MVAALMLGLAEIEWEWRKERHAVGIAVVKRQGAYKGCTPGTTKAKPAQARELQARGMAAPEIAQARGTSPGPSSTTPRPGADRHGRPADASGRRERPGRRPRTAGCPASAHMRVLPRWSGRQFCDPADESPVVLIARSNTE
ncbi:MAG: hypothetical protein JOZ53_09620 [Planctomycetaceae bacterium]|nr:hypothetical protein [Planctomycetaceae bacterium]